MLIWEEAGLCPPVKTTEFRLLLVCLFLLPNFERVEAGSVICSFFVCWAGSLYPRETLSQCLWNESAFKTGVLLPLKPGAVAWFLSRQMWDK